MDASSSSNPLSDQPKDGSAPLRPTISLGARTHIKRLQNSTALDELAALGPEEFQAEKRRLVRKIDLRLLPILFVLIVLNYLDRNALASARVQGLGKDLGLKGEQFNAAISVLFAGYILGQLPSNMILTRVRPSLYLPACVAFWGVVSGLTSLVQNFTGLIIVRLFLDLVEAPYFPGALFLLSSWYTRKELALRTAWLYSGSLLSGAFTGLIAAGIQNGLNGARGIAPWRWLVIIEACLTVFFAGLAVFLLPDWPSQTRWLTVRERALAVLRLERGAGEADEEKTSVFQGPKDAVMDYKVWFLSAIITTKTSAASFTQFIPTVINTFGYSKTNTLLLQAPPYVFATLASLACSWSSDRRGNRCWHVLDPMIRRQQRPGHDTVAIFLGLGGVYASYTPALAWISGTVPRPKAKRSSAYALVNMIGNIAQIYSPYMYNNVYSPRFIPAMAANVGFCLLTCVCALVLRRCLIAENRKLDEQERRDSALDKDDKAAPKLADVAAHSKAAGRAVDTVETGPAVTPERVTVPFRYML